MDSIKIINQQEQYGKLVKIKAMIEKEWMKIDDKELEGTDKALKARFDRIINSAFLSNWMNINYVELYLNNINIIIQKHSYDSLFPILTYTCLVDIFKYKLLKQDDFVINLTIDSLCNKSITNYEKYGKLLLDDKMIKKINELNNLKTDYDYETYRDCDDLLEDMNFELPHDKLLKNSLEYFNVKINNYKTRNDSILDKDTNIKDIYFILKREVEQLLDIIDKAFDENIYLDLKQILKVNRASIIEQKNFINDAIKVYDSDLDFVSKVNKIIYLAENVIDNNEINNVINYDFGNSKSR